MSRSLEDIGMHSMTQWGEPGKSCIDPKELPWKGVTLTYMLED